MPTDSYEITANAKINLFLRVNGTLPNGYHRLYTVMQEIDYADQLTITLDPSRRGFKINCFGRNDIDPEKNLCKKACDRFYSNLKKLQGDDFTAPYTEIDLVKNIPSESGMGGGSSDAAAVLVVLQEHFGQPFSEEELLRIAVNVGADVPFFLYGGTCLCERVGEVIKPLENLTGLGVLIGKPKAGVSTPECFGLMDREERKPFDEKAYSDYIDSLNVHYRNSSDMLEKFLAGRELLVNDLEAPAVKLVPEIETIKRAFTNAGAEYCCMTGSGSAVFALFGNRGDAAAAMEQVKDVPALAGCSLYLSETV
ncbi:MAG: 4-(cytidine 5'-diphospho)-2-C-methyl-D-erythritol kinase [Clostridiales bacterium]|nr:4-(cytidine 5'-diphospho)-2-C-methyl-D-erythritol kinase [Clostridiales bacterium]MBR6488595.1 4-(cytidine 5'-diphospho)-2-C-methyl-D-erythritol kinase [Clostridiales bacterium]